MLGTLVVYFHHDILSLQHFPDTLELREDSPPGTWLLWGSKVTFSEDDLHLRPTATFCLHGPNMTSFTVDHNSGDIRTTEPLDREVRDVYDVIVVVTSGGKSAKVRVRVKVVDVNDNPPVFLGDFPKTLNLREDSDLGE